MWTVAKAKVVLSQLPAPFIEYPLKFVERQLFRQPAAEDFDMITCVMNQEVIDFMTKTRSIRAKVISPARSVS